jgi:hypothetical protein
MLATPLQAHRDVLSISSTVLKDITPAGPEAKVLVRGMLPHENLR